MLPDVRRGATVAGLFALFHQLFYRDVEPWLMIFENVVRDYGITIVAVGKLFLWCRKMFTGNSKEKENGCDEENSQRTLEHNI